MGGRVWRGWMGCMHMVCVLLCVAALSGACVGTESECCLSYNPSCTPVLQWSEGVGVTHTEGWAEGWAGVDTERALWSTTLCECTYPDLACQYGYTTDTDACSGTEVCN
ncbi:hypothetical protein KIPB_010400 [Kipferlia bialata]|uniref:Uncharacterized protein n=1 Tax=Kipferlia bialata TaxID=797122 RepID=A0A391NWI7_9EUKA|nr:hypothetical protein KIPB_010400 [Kipferlia bialata]|eukprot:g10400.t1